MRGYIKTDSSHSVEFGFAVPVPEGGMLSFDVTPVTDWAQRREPEPSTLIGTHDSPAGPQPMWEEARPGEIYQCLGVYLGRQLVLTARAGE